MLYLFIENIRSEGMLKKRSFFAAVLIIILTLGVFLYMVTFCGSYSVYIPENYISDLSDIKVTYSQDGIANHSEPVYDNGYIRLTFNSLKQGKTEAEIFAFKESDPRGIFLCLVLVLQVTIPSFKLISSISKDIISETLIPEYMIKMIACAFSLYFFTPLL